MDGCLIDNNMRSGRSQEAKLTGEKNLEHKTDGHRSLHYHQVFNGSVACDFETAELVLCHRNGSVWSTKPVYMEQ
ncbi:hypothetical protein E2C01_070160 [Portunus trituberculatus]|uniref:Uncharacterized protein n=1 Tax=Portunus trituberculatus TaxID=210409 RepID=A0A5B7I1D7_PORTR|nr:hypothetical protein [Portunus trituberculatus]